MNPAKPPTRLLGIVFCLAIASGSSAEQAVWIWDKECSSGRVLLEVSLDKKVLHHATYPICRQLPATALPENEPIVTRFTAPRRFRTDRDSGFGLSMTKGTHVEVNLWRASADADAMALGVSLVAKDRVFVNTIHLAWPNKPSRSEILRGLVVRTTPLHPLPAAPR
jgi:hypothetical protein